VLLKGQSVFLINGKKQESGSFESGKKKRLCMYSVGKMKIMHKEIYSTIHTSNYSTHYKNSRKSSLYECIFDKMAM